MLENSLSCSERTRNTVCTTLGDREECIDDPDSRHHRICRPHALLISFDSYLYRLSDDHGELFLVSILISDRTYCLMRPVHAVLSDGLYRPLPLKGERNEYHMGEKAFWNSSERISGNDFITDLLRCGEFPFLIWKRIKINTSLKEESAFLRKFRKRVLKTIEYL